MIIGVLKEANSDNRVSVTPDSVTDLLKKKTEVLVEKNAGQNAFISDTDYINAGAVVTSRSEILKNASVIIVVNPPDIKEIESLSSDKVIIGALDPFVNVGLVKKLVNKNITSFSLELVPRITRAQNMDILSSMATIAGYKAVLDAAMHLPKFFPMFMSAAGTIRPAKVLIIGAGVAGLQAIAVSRKLGAVVEVFDVRSAVKEEVESLGAKFIEVEGATEDRTAGGYAVEQTKEYRQKQNQLIHDHAIKSNVVICTAQIPGKKAPLLITKDTVDHMMQGSVIIDLAVSTGGNCELSNIEKTIKYKGITIIGNSVYPSEMPSDASAMFGRNVTNFLKLLISEEGEFHLNFEDEIVKGTCLTHKGAVVNERVKTLIS